MKIKLFFSKAITYIRNKIFRYIFFTQIRIKVKNKLINYKEYLRKINEKKKETLILSFIEDYKIKCDSTDLTAIGETCILEDYQKINAFKIKPGYIVFDIGAHIGSFSMYAANKGALVYAFEPEKNNFNKLVENIKLNNYENKIKAYNYGIYNKNGEISFTLENNNSAGHSISQDNASNRISIKVKKLSDVIEEERLKKIDLLKIDVEGSEYIILPDLNKDTYDKIDRIVGEYHLSYDVFDKNYSLIKNTLKPHYKKIDWRMPYYFYAQK